MVGYLVTIDPHLLSSPHVQPVLFFILSSLPLLWYFLAFYLFLRCLLMSTPLSLWIEGFSFCLFFHLHVLLFSFISSFFSPPGSRSMVFVFIFSLLSVWCLLLCLHHLSPFLSLPFILFTSPILLGFSSLSRCFHIHTPFSLSLCASRSFLPCSPPYFFFHCPLIFMRLTGQPHSAPLSLSVGEEAAQCQQLMDFWRTQTAMHHSPENYIGRKRRRIWSEANGRVIWDREGNRRMRERVIAKKKIKIRGSSQAIHGKEIGEKNILLVGAIINKNSLQI